MSENTPAGELPIPSPEALELTEQCRRLANELADLLAEKDHLTTSVIPNITAQYASVVGVREFEQLRLEVESRRLKRILEHIQAIENRGEQANVEQIEAAVEDELKDWNLKLQQMAAQVRSGKDHLAHQLSDEQSAEFRKVYRALARKLHPDVNPDLAARHRALWARVQEAYKAGDLEELRTLLLVVDDIPDETVTPSALEILRKRRDGLRASVRVTIDQIASIKESPPFALLQNLSDPRWLAEKLRECGENSARLSQRVEELSAKLAAWKTNRG